MTTEIEVDGCTFTCDDNVAVKSLVENLMQGNFKVTSLSSSSWEDDNLMVKADFAEIERRYLDSLHERDPKFAAQLLGQVKQRREELRPITAAEVEELRDRLRQCGHSVQTMTMFDRMARCIKQPG